MKINSNIIYKNPLIDIISYACSKCYDTKLKPTQEEKAEYIARRISTGHESILEHGNIITEYKIPIKMYNDFIVLSPYLKYLNVAISEDKDYFYLLLAGSPRGYKHIFRMFPYHRYPNNQLLNSIKLELQNNTSTCLYGDFINDNLFDNLLYVENDELQDPIKLSEYVTILNIDNLSEVFHNLNGSYSIDDILDTCTVSIEFNNISRVISQQYTRHRNAITQESQRYVDYSNARFNSPDLFNDNLDKDIKYNVNGSEYTLKELGESICKIYPQLLSQGLKKEDARAFLPNNVVTSFVMTFTYRNLIKFLQLRTHAAAQNEIRKTAKVIEEWFINYLHENVYDKIDIYSYLEPSYIENDSINDFIEVYNEPPTEELFKDGTYDENKFI